MREGVSETLETKPREEERERERERGTHTSTHTSSRSSPKFEGRTPIWLDLGRFAFIDVMHLLLEMNRLKMMSMVATRRALRGL